MFHPNVTYLGTCLSSSGINYRFVIEQKTTKIVFQSLHFLFVWNWAQLSGVCAIKLFYHYLKIRISKITRMGNISAMELFNIRRWTNNWICPIVKHICLTIGQIQLFVHLLILKSSMAEMLPILVILLIRIFR